MRVQRSMSGLKRSERRCSSQRCQPASTARRTSDAAPPPAKIDGSRRLRHVMRPQAAAGPATSSAESASSASRRTASASVGSAADVLERGGWMELLGKTQ